MTTSWVATLGEWLHHRRVRADRDNGQLAPGVDPASAARGMIAIMDGAQVQWLLDRESIDMAEETRMFVRLLITVDL